MQILMEKSWGCDNSRVRLAVRSGTCRWCLRLCRFGLENEPVPPRGFPDAFCLSLQADYFSCVATVVYMRKENCMYQACPSQDCNKKVIDEQNGLYRCEKCDREFPNFKYRMILSVSPGGAEHNFWLVIFLLKLDHWRRGRGIYVFKPGSLSWAEERKSKWLSRVFLTQSTFYGLWMLA